MAYRKLFAAAKRAVGAGEQEAEEGGGLTKGIMFFLSNKSENAYYSERSVKNCMRYFNYGFLLKDFFAFMLQIIENVTTITTGRNKKGFADS